ncbi:serine protease [Streptomyces sp. DH37]|uniref:S1 family peptidase n=1 Tax=Streptomyces sp. DH37 TaxID=3040122 RepID=UPI0024431E34|nr:serine protease [Streptomyces sp. DH37]MDG9704585.1 serine protease [Streptomyces sp. DH37]
MRSKTLGKIVLSLVSVISLGLGAAGPAAADSAPPAGAPVAGKTEAVGKGGPEGIIGGETADSSRGMAALHRNGNFLCSGSIVDNRWVLTARHCLYPDGERIPDSQLTVRVKSLDRTSGGGVVAVSDSKVRTEHDIAMLKLDRSANAEPVRLATANPEVGATTYVFGWGRTCATCAPSTVLKRATMRVESIDADDVFGGRAIRTSGLNGRTCYGDSGGPLFKLVDGQRYQVGVVSGGNAGCPDDSGFRFASTPTSLTWIQNVMADF